MEIDRSMKEDVVEQAVKTYFTDQFPNFLYSSGVKPASARGMVLPTLSCTSC